jgi:hypothetical protein
MRTACRLLAASLLIAAPCAAKEARFFTLDNDSWFDTDRYYTNGVQLAWRDAADTRGELARRWTGAACCWLGCGDARYLFGQHSVGQLMYTPGDITVPAPQPLDRPYAGLLYVERNWLFLDADGQTLTTLGAQFGATGRLSLAEPAQKLIHRIVDRPQPRGWDHQVGTTLAVMLSAERRVAWPALSGPIAGNVRLHTAGYMRAALGNTMTYAAGGLTLTIGKNQPPVSPAPPGIANRLAGGATADTSCLWEWLQCTLVLGAEGRGMAYNLSLQGRPWREDPGVRPRRWVGDLMAGLRLDFPGTRGREHGPWFVQFRTTRRTAEFRAPTPVRRHTVGSLTLGIDF